MSLPTFGVRFQLAKWGEMQWLLGYCPGCKQVRRVEAYRAIAMKFTNPVRWWARCEQRLRTVGGASGQCKGMVKPVGAQEDEEAMVAAYLVGGDEAAKACARQVLAREKKAQRKKGL